MINQTLAQCLVLFMLFITSSRFIFIQNAKTDSLSIVPLIALVISVLNLFLFNINDLDILLTFLSPAENRIMREIISLWCALGNQRLFCGSCME